MSPRNQKVFVAGKHLLSVKDIQYIISTAEMAKKLELTAEFNEVLCKKLGANHMASCYLSSSLKSRYSWTESATDEEIADYINEYTRKCASKINKKPADLRWMSEYAKRYRDRLKTLQRFEPYGVPPLFKLTAGA